MSRVPGSAGYNDARRFAELTKAALEMAKKEGRAPSGTYNPPASPDLIQKAQQAYDAGTAYRSEIQAGKKPFTENPFSAKIPSSGSGTKPGTWGNQMGQAYVEAQKAAAQKVGEASFSGKVAGAQVGSVAVAPAVPGPSAATKVITSPAGGAAIGAGVVAVAQAGIEISQGGDPLAASIKAGATGLGSFAGSVIGGGIGGLGGSVPGAYVGATVGGIAGSVAGSIAGNSIVGLLEQYGIISSKKPVAPTPVSPITKPPPIEGGKFTGVFYNVYWGAKYGKGYGNYPNNPFQTEMYHPGSGIPLVTQAYGPILSYHQEVKEFPPNSIGEISRSWNKGFMAFDSDGKSKYYGAFGGAGTDGTLADYQASADTSVFQILKIERADGLPEEGIQPIFVPVIPIIVSDPIGGYQPSPAAPPSGAAPPGVDPSKNNPLIPASAGNPDEAVKKKPVTFKVPAGTAIKIKPATGAEFDVGPFPQDMDFEIPSNLPSGQASTPITVKDPSGKPVVISTPGTGPVTIQLPGQQPITIDPTGTKANSGLTPVFPPEVKPTFTPTPLKESPLVPSKDKDIGIVIPGVPGNNDLATIGTTLVGIKQILDGLAKNTSPEAIQSAAAAGTCSTLQPGGCMSGLANNASSAASNSATANNLASANLAATGANTGLLNTILTRLGAQLPGGLAGAATRLSASLGIDRALAVINFASNLHNAFMLSNALKTTLLQALSSVGNATGLLQSSEGENIDLNKVYNQGIEQILTFIMGEENYAKFEVGWRKYNRIYQAATNSLNAISQMFNSIGEVIEVAAEYTGRIGNALKAAGQVSENAYAWMAEKMNVKSSKFMRFSTTTAGVTQALEVVNEIAESVVEAQEGYTEAVKANKEFLEELRKADRKPGVDNEKVAEEIKKNKEAASKDPTGEDESGLLSFLTDF